MIKTLSEEQKREITQLVNKMAWGQLGISLFYVLLLFLGCVITTLLGVLVAHSNLFCVIMGFVNFILYHKASYNAQKKHRLIYSAKFKEVLSK